LIKWFIGDIKHINIFKQNLRKFTFTAILNVKIQVQLTAHHLGIFPSRKCLPSGGKLLVWSSHIFAILEQTSENWKYYTTILKISSNVQNTLLFSTYESHRLATNRFCPQK
jgi:hypothetical protein